MPVSDAVSIFAFIPSQLLQLGVALTTLLVMRPMLSVVVLLLLASRNPLFAHDLPGCRRGTYLDANVGRCMPCTDGVNFIDEEYNRQPQCRECTTCVGMMVLAVACEASHDTVCRCRDGYVKTVENLCRLAQHPEDDRSSVAEAPGTRSEPAVAERQFVDSKKVAALQTVGYLNLFFILFVIVAGIWLIICCFIRRRKIDNKLIHGVEALIEMVSPHSSDSRGAQNSQRITTAASSSRVNKHMHDEEPEEASRSDVNKTGAHPLRSGSSIILHKRQDSSVTIGALSVG